MKHIGRCLWPPSALALALAAILSAIASPAAAQVGVLAPQPRFDLSEAVQLDRADGVTLAQLERVKACLADRQWGDAIDALQKLAETADGKLMPVTEHRFVPIGDYCQLQLASLPAEALKLYRGRVDPAAWKWFAEGVSRRDRKPLENVVSRAFASSYGDKALLALGEIALESGDCAAARECWERILPVAVPPDQPRTWPGYPDTTLDPAMVRARLVLASILEGDAVRAREELAAFVRLHPGARGRLGGREVNFAEALGQLAAESVSWPSPPASPDWPTFAGNRVRDKIAARAIDVAQVAWQVPLSKDALAARGANRLLAFADTPSCFPLIAGDRLFFNGAEEISAVRLSDGRPLWDESTPVIYRDPMDEAAAASSLPFDALGAGRFTMTAFDGRLLARMGSPITVRPQQPSSASGSSSLVCLDLEAEGKLLWRVVAGEGWAFEGSPVVDGLGVYAAMRRSDARPQAHVACFDPQTGRLRWRRFICAAESPGRGLLPQCTHNLLTLRGETLYYNTNLGAVAALSTPQGRVLWVSLYPRARHVDLLRPAAHWRRDLTPCLYRRGTLYVAPADAPSIFALDAGTGQMLWRIELEDATHLLGVGGDCLIAGGGRLYWIGLTGPRRGQLRSVRPESAEKPGFGRGVLAGDSVFWPTRERIYVFDQRTAELKRWIDLAALGTVGGNLVVADGRLLIAGPTELVALGLPAKSSRPAPHEVAAVGPPLPLGEGWGEGKCPWGRDFIGGVFRGSPHPNPLPKGEGTSHRLLAN